MRPVVLIILDGWGIAPAGEGNAITLANTPHLDRLEADGLTTVLDASGLAVGLPEGQIGNSEVGHLNLGAGFRVVQDLPRIDQAIAEGRFGENEALLGAVRHARENGRTLHLIGLFSHGGVHSHARHLEALLRLASREGIARVAVHLILDGRDTPPRQALSDLPGLEAVLNETGVGRIATVVGRYFAMDRDRRWDRVSKAYNAYVVGNGPAFPSAREAIESAYAEGVNDEFVVPSIIGGGPDGTINDGDSVVFFNYRSDRVRQLSRALIVSDFEGFIRSRIVTDIHFVSMTEYEADLPVTAIAFPPLHVERPLARVVSNLGGTQCHIAETEKYAHVTFFLNGGRETPYPGEDRILIPSPGVATYDLQPAMSAEGVAGAAVQRISTRHDDLVVMNFANCDMVGHTGKLGAARQAVEAVDRAVGTVVSAARADGRVVLVTSDHGNAEVMIDPETGGPFTAHTTNPVPLYLIGAPEAARLVPHGQLSSVAPTILRLMGIAVPAEMTSPDLFAPGSVVH
ncbi:MAG: 2,3-bisphosphoglycerate-independent phosphoglycerate mutase [Chloroflexi bacterium]|nr:2,3-bisphosphoglycerate-independent phosphoglycerate mutase [Chloroflexota bacterium]